MTTTLPDDIINLIAGYLIQSLYSLDPELTNITPIEEFGGMYHMYANLGKNPKALGRNFPVKHYQLGSLASNPNPKINKIIMGRYYNWMDYIICKNSSRTSAELLTKLLDNPHAKPIVNKIFDAYPNILNELELIDWAKSNPVASEHLIAIAKNSCKPWSIDILANSSDIVLDTYMEASVLVSRTESIKWLLSNPNPRAIEFAFKLPRLGSVNHGFLVKFDKLELSNLITNKFSYKSMELLNKKIINDLVCSLSVNPSEQAGKLFNRILANSGDSSPDYDLVSHILTNSTEMYTNPSNYIMDFLEKYFVPDFIKSNPAMDGSIQKLASNQNTRALNLLISLDNSAVHAYRFELGSNPGAVHIIKSHPKIFSNVATIYSNQAIFVGKPDIALIKKIRHILY